MANKNENIKKNKTNDDIKMNNFFAPADKNHDTGKERVGVIVWNKYYRLKEAITNYKKECLKKIRFDLCYVKDEGYEKEYEKLCEKIGKKIISDCEEIEKDLEKKYNECQYKEIDDRKFEGFITEYGKVFEERIKKNIEKLLREQIDSIKDNGMNRFTCNKGVSEGQQEEIELLREKLEYSKENKFCEIEIQDMDNDECDKNNKEQNNKSETTKNKTINPKKKNENKNENLKRANRVDETLNKGNFFTKPWKESTTGEKVGFIFAQMGLFLLTGSLFTICYLIHKFIKNGCACYSKEAINTIEEGKKI